MREVAGVKEASVDVLTMELVVAAEGGPVDMRKVIEAVRAAGFDVKR